MSWLDTLIHGIKNVVFGGATLPARDAIEFAGAAVQVTDDAANARTKVTFNAALLSGPELSLLDGATASSTPGTLVKRGATGGVAVGSLDAGGLVTCSAGAYVGGRAGFACSSMECEGSALFDGAAQFDAMVTCTAGMTLSLPLTWAGDITESRVAAAHPVLMTGSGWTFTSDIWTNTTLGTSLQIPINPPQGCVIQSIAVSYRGASGHSALPAVKPTIALCYWDVNLIGTQSVANSTKADPATSTSALQSFHAIVSDNDGAGINHAVDKTTRRYYVLVTAESGANALTGANYYACTVTWTRPAGSDIGQD